MSRPASAAIARPAGAGAVDERAAGDARSVLQDARRRWRLPSRSIPATLALHVFGAERARLRRKACSRPQPSNQPSPERPQVPAARSSVVEPGEALLQRGRVEIDGCRRPRPSAAAWFSARIDGAGRASRNRDSRPPSARSPAARHRPRGARRCCAGSRCRRARCGCSPRSKIAAGSRPPKGPRPRAGRWGPSR